MFTCNKLVYLILLIGFTACKNNFSIINGVVNNCESCVVSLNYYDYGQLREVKLRETKVRKGKFTFSINADSIPRPGVYEIQMALNEGNSYKNEFSETLTPHIYLPADTVNLVMNPAGLPQKKTYPYPNSSSDFGLVDIKSTSSEQQELNFYLQQRDSMDMKSKNYNNLKLAFFNQAIESGNKQEMNKWADSLNNGFATGGLYRPKAADAFIRKYPTSKLVPYVMLDNHERISAAPRFRKYYKAMLPEQQNSYEGKVLDKRLAWWERRNTRYAKYIVGAEITYITGKTPQGDTLQENKIFRKIN